MTFVQDGDTATLKPAKGDPLNCRIDMIDAPETAKKDKPGQSHGEQSAAHLRRLIDKKEVTVWVKNGTDLYGRSLCQIEVDVNGKGVDVSLDMLQNGAAWLYRQYGGSAAYKNAADNAQYKGKGLFADRDAIHPREFKRQ